MVQNWMHQSSTWQKKNIDPTTFGPTFALLGMYVIIMLYVANVSKDGCTCCALAWAPVVACVGRCVRGSVRTWLSLSPSTEELADLGQQG